MTLLLLLGCSHKVDAGLPAGDLILGDGRALARAAACLAAFPESPAASVGRATSTALAACPELAAEAREGTSMVPLSCRADAPAQALSDLRGPADIAFALHTDPAHRAVGTLTVGSDGGLTLDARLDAESLAGALGLLVGGGAPPGPTVLALDHAVVHARVRPVDGIDLPSLVPAGGELDTRLRMRASLFSKTVLDGSWEAAIYAPPTGRTTPLLALALGTRDAGLASAAMRAYLDDVETHWTTRETALDVRGARGACLPDLTFLPSLAPCYVLSRDQLVVGWDARSIQHALDPAMNASPALPEASALRVDFEQMADFDRRVADAAHLPPEPSTRYPWGRLQVTSIAEDGVVTIRARTDRGCAP